MATAVTKQDAKKFLSDVSEEFIFRCVCGQTYKNMQELADNLATMTDESFVYHVNAEKNDFANWVRDIIGDQKLEADLRSSADRLTAIGRVNVRIAFLRKKIA